MQEKIHIAAYVPYGSGAMVPHCILAQEVAQYRLNTYSPTLEYWPFRMHRLRDPAAALVHAPLDHAIFVCPRSTPLVVTLHNYVLDAAMRPHSSLMQRVHYATDLRLFTSLALRRAAMVTAVSEFTARLVREDMRFSGLIEVIPNGVDVERFQPASEREESGPLRVLFSGNLTRRKGADLLPEIARLAGPDVQIHYTTGARAGIGDPRWTRLEPVGRVPYAQMPDLYRRFDVLLFPTVREGFGLAVAEAMATGLAIVASNSSTMPELVADGKGGLLCPVGEPEAYAAALRTLAADRALVRRMGAHNRAVVEQRYTAERMVAGYRAVFERVLGRSLG